MALLPRPAPVAPVASAPGAVAATLSTDDLNRLVADVNAQLDALWAALAAVDARLTAARL